MSLYETKALGVSPPTSSAGTTGLDGVFRIATAATAQRFNIPAGWKNRYVTFQAIGLDIQIVFGGSAIAPTLNAVSTVASEDITFNAASAYTVLAGTSKDFFVPNNKTYTDFAFISTGTTGFVEAYPSDIVHPSQVNGAL